MVVSINNENNANSTAVMRMLGQLNTLSLCFDKWAQGWTDQIIENYLSRPTNGGRQQQTVSPCHCPDIMWALRRRNTRISNDIVMQFLRLSVKMKRCAKNC